MEIRRRLIRTGAALALVLAAVPARASLEENGTPADELAAVERGAEDMPGGEDRLPEALPPGLPALEATQRLFLVAQHDRDRIALCLVLRNLELPAGDLRVWMSSGEDRVEVANPFMLSRNIFFTAPPHPAGPVRFHLEIDRQEWGHADYIYPPAPGDLSPLMRDSLGL